MLGRLQARSEWWGQFRGPRLSTSPQPSESLCTLKDNPGPLREIRVYQHGKLSSRPACFDGVARENLTGIKAALANDALPRASTAIALHGGRLMTACTE